MKTFDTARTCCFTGHRPEKLQANESGIKSALEAEIKAAISRGFCNFITGMARGVDTWAAQIVLKLKGEGNDIHLICAFAYKKAKLSIDDLTAQNSSDYIYYASEIYSRSCYMERNKWMVDNSSIVIAVYNGKKGGTLNTINYAQKRQIPITYIRV